MAGSQEDMMSYEVGSGSGIPEDLKGNMTRRQGMRGLRRSERLPNG